MEGGQLKESHLRSQTNQAAEERTSPLRHTYS